LNNTKEGFVMIKKYFLLLLFMSYGIVAMENGRGNIHRSKFLEKYAQILADCNRRDSELRSIDLPKELVRHGDITKIKDYNGSFSQQCCKNFFESFIKIMLCRRS
jgi:hypothetical protein